MLLIVIFCMAVKVDTQKEIIFGSSEPNISRVLSKKEKDGELRKLTRHKDPLAYINVMTKLHQFSDNLYGTDFTELKNYLAACNAYEDPSQAKLQIIDRTIH